MALCFGCMKENNGEQICPHCGFDRNTEQSVPYLPLGTNLQDKNYLIGKIQKYSTSLQRNPSYDVISEEFNDSMKYSDKPGIL